MANYLYNGVELPNINTVWTDRKTYPFAYINYSFGNYYLVLTTVLFYVYFSNDKRYGVYSPTGTRLEHPLSKTTGEWRTDYMPPQPTSGALTSNPIWASHDMFRVNKKETDSGTFYETTDIIALAASEPVPVNPAPTLDPTALLMGWQVGNRIRQSK